MNLALVLTIGAGLALPEAAFGKPLSGAPGSSAVVPAASSAAHRSDGLGNYGALRSGRPVPGRPIPSRPIPGRAIPYRGLPDYGPLKSQREEIKQPYPYHYYEDTDRGNVGCYRLARRAIETNNRNWWARYRACTEGPGD
jgi:hypothetical protein